MTIGEQPRRRLVRRAVTRDHVGRNRPGSAAEAEKRHRRQAAPLSPAESSRRSARARRRSTSPRSSGIAAGSSSGSSCGPSPPQSGRCGRAHAESPEYRKTKSPHRSRIAGSAAASPPRQASAQSKDRARCRRFSAPPGIPADSARPGASSRPAERPGACRRAPREAVYARTLRSGCSSQLNTRFLIVVICYAVGWTHAFASTAAPRSARAIPTVRKRCLWKPLDSDFC